MSVINKMLRDLDARRAGGAVPDLSRQGGPAAVQGTVSVPLSGPQRARGSRVRVLMACLLGAVLLALVNLGDFDFDPSPEPAATPAAAPAPAPMVQAAAEPSAPPVPPPLAPASAAMPPQLAASAAASAPGPVARAPVAVVPSRAASEPADERGSRRKTDEAPGPAKTPQAPLPTTAGPVRQEGTPTRVVGTPSAKTPTAPAAASVMAPTTPVPKSAAPTTPPRWQTAAQETLAQAQALWNGGSREAALELVREAVGAVERAAPPDTALLAQLVREQVRMELALGRPGAVLSLLMRLETPLAGQADLWAQRGSAAQRLGRHEESVQAYLSALQLRPGEARWMLGAAVSLAALGRLDAAAQQAEQARALGPVSPEVLGYLRQAGVPLR